MKLMLASDASAFLPRIIKNKRNKKFKMAFIPTAADPYRNKWWIRKDKRILTKSGIDLVEVDLKNKDRKWLLRELATFDMIYVAGGNSFYLLEKMRESGFDKIVKRLLNQGIIYIGSSAGAVVAGPDIFPTRFLDNPSKSKIKSFKGLNLVNFIPLPHFGAKRYKKAYKNVLKDLGKTKFKSIKIKDNQAVLIEGEKIKTIKV